MAKVLVTGGTGLLGSALVPLLQIRGHQVTLLGNTQITQINADLTSYEQTAKALDKAMPEVIINLVALTNVNRCESNPQEAYLLNIKSVQNLCTWMQSTVRPCHLIHISTDQVYDGIGPHTEVEITIRNHYAMSKLAGEFSAGTVNSTILRTNFVGRSLRDGRTSFTDWLYDALRRGISINVFEDILFSPLAIGTLCNCIERSILEQPSGVFNVGSRDGMSKADFAFEFAHAVGLPTNSLVRSRAAEIYALTAPRPKDMRMQCDKFERRMGLKLPSLINEVQYLSKDYR